MTTNTQRPAVSIVMPIFNPGDYLFQSMDSVIGQTFPNIQIVCVNDGSTDGSLTVLREYAKRDKRIVVIDKPNRGYGHAMNVGIEAAVGEYIMILEPDDYMERNMVETLYGTATRLDCDIVKSNYWEYEGSSNKNTFIRILGSQAPGVVTNAMENPRMLLISPCIWTAIYRKQLLVENDIRFNETPGAAYQDTAFAYKALISANRVTFLDDSFIHYRTDNDSSSVKSTGKIFNVCDEFASVESFVGTNHKLRTHLMPAIQAMKFSTYIWNLNRIADEYKTLFQNRIALEMIKADYDGFLKKEYFNDTLWEELQSIVHDYHVLTQSQNTV